jgi:uncharacterized membrane protein
MTHIRPLGIGLLAMFVSIVLTSASASALLAEPEIGRCVKVASGTGEYEVASCTGGAKAAGGRYDWQLAAKKNFVSGGGVGTLETPGGKKIECKSFLGKGEYYAPFPQDETINVRLFGCKEFTFNFECHNNAPEELDFAMFGEYGFINNFINKAGNLVVAVGMSLKIDDPQKFECGPNKNQFVFGGGAIGRVTPIDKMSSTFAFKFAAVKGKQKPAKFEGGVNQAFVLEETSPPMPPEEAGLTITYSNSNEEPLEIKAKE